MPNNYQAWRKKSEENLKWADDNLKAGNFPLVCYLAQQAVELLLKGYLYSQNKIPPKTHQLIRLAKFSEKLGLKIKGLLPKLAILSEYYLESRYPDQLNVDLNDKKNLQRNSKSTPKRITKLIWGISQRPPSRTKRIFNNSHKFVRTTNPIRVNQL